MRAHCAGIIIGTIIAIAGVTAIATTTNEAAWQIGGLELIMPRYWLSGPRLFNGLVRPGISFSGRELAAWGRKAPKVASDGVLGVVRRPDGALALAVPNANPAGIETAGAGGILYVLTFSSREDAIEARAGTLVRMGKHVGEDGWITGQSVGQVLAACRSEANALGLDATSFRIRKPDEKPARQSGGLRHWLAVVAWLAVFVGLMVWFGR